MTISVLLLLAMCGVAASASAFTSFYVFGDGVSSMTNGPGGSFYYKGTYSNGRVWVEVLAERQGLVCESNKNQSYYGQYSTNLLVSLNSFVVVPSRHADDIPRHIRRRMQSGRTP